MSEQPNPPGGPGGGHPSPQSMGQVPQTFALTPQSMSDLEVTAMGQMAMGGLTPTLHPLNPATGQPTLDSLAPKFPPQNFDVPDINFSNSVSPNVDFDQSLFSSGQMFTQPNTLYSSPEHAQPIVSSQTSGGGAMQVSSASAVNPMTPMTSSQRGSLGQQQMKFLPPSSNSPPGTSSSEDSDDLPLAQLAKRVWPVGSASPTPTTTASSSSPPSHTGPAAETTSVDTSPTPVVGAKKGKPSKRKKKKDPNEPQKPVSAYALFFRDTQATIKGHNPSASFGEVSKIVASMWEQLDPEHKEVYKKKTEMAKKQYLKQLAAYRASQVSQLAAEEAEKSPSPPNMAAGPPQTMGNNPVGPLPGSVMSSSHMPVTAGQVITSQQMAQMSSQMMQQQHQQQQHQQQQHQQQQQLHQMHHHQLQLQQHQMTLASPQHPQQQQHSPPQGPLQQQQHSSGPGYGGSPSHMGSCGFQTQQSLAEQQNNALLGFPDPSMDMDAMYPTCVRNGCSNRAQENLAWDAEYCSNDCVITHCRDIFTTWRASRSGSNTFPVK